MRVSQRLLALFASELPPPHATPRCLDEDHDNPFMHTGNGTNTQIYASKTSLTRAGCLPVNTRSTRCPCAPSCSVSGMRPRAKGGVCPATCSWMARTGPPHARFRGSGFLTRLDVVFCCRRFCARLFPGVRWHHRGGKEGPSQRRPWPLCGGVCPPPTLHHGRKILPCCSS